MKRYFNNYILIIFSLLPISFIIGPSVSLLNILIIDLTFVIFLIYKNEKFFQKSSEVKYFFILFIYLVFNTLVSLDYSLSLQRNLGFLRIILLFMAFNYFLKDKKILNKVFVSWCLIFLTITFDVFFESIFQKNILGFSSEFGGRIVSFFRNEPIIGGYINAFYLILIGFLFNKYEEKKYLILILSIIILSAVILTGERSNSIKAFIGFIIFFIIYQKFTNKFKFFSVIILTISILIFILNHSYLKHRFVDQIKALVTVEGNPYTPIYKSGLKVFYNNPILGVGNKNYRVETCKNLFVEEDYICQTHPHQVYIEFLAEHGILGSFIIFYLLYKLIFSKIKLAFSSQNYIQIGAGIYLILVFFPLIPSGAFFSDYLLSLFAINLSIFYCSNLKMNIFTKNDKNLWGR